MKSTRIFFIAFILFSCSPRPKNPGGGMNYFSGNFDAAITEASQKHKPIFIYGYATWCGYCKKMDRSTFKEKEVNDYMNENYINLSYDLEKGEGTYIANKYSLRSYPAYVLLNEKGELFAVTGGYMDTEKFLAWVKNRPAK
jgi:thioredoxin 1